MRNYQVGRSTPEAFITKNKQRVKQFNHNLVYLKDGDNFEIELFNPKSIKVLAKIYLDGKLISSSGIIIKPGQRIHLERHIETNHKFVYKTYEVNGENQQVQDAIKSNGELDVKFYDETVATDYNSHFFYDPIYSNTCGCGTITTGGCGGCGGCGCSSGYATMSGNSTTTFAGPDLTYTTSNYSADVPTAFLSTTSLDSTPSPGTYKKPAKRLKSTVRSAKMETGTVEKGEVSNQEFTYSNDSFNYHVCNEIKWKILPLSQKPITSNEIKVFCTDCGTRRKKQSHKFCPNCGTKFE